MRPCLIKAIILIDDLIIFARRQAILQGIVLSDSVIVQHNGKAVPVTEPVQSIWTIGQALQNYTAGTLRYAAAG